MAAGNAVPGVVGVPVVRTPTAPSVACKAGTSTSLAAPAVSIAILSDCDIAASSRVALAAGAIVVSHHGCAPHRPVVAAARAGAPDKASDMTTAAPAVRARPNMACLGRFLI